MSIVILFNSFLRLV